MNIQKTQNLKQKLDKRFNQLRSARFDGFPQSLLDFWSFFDNEPILSGIRENLLGKFPDISKASEILRQVSRSDSPRATIQTACPKSVSFSYNNCKTQPEIDENYLSVFRDLYLDKFIFFVEEQLDSFESEYEKQSEILKILYRYKRRSEWFHRRKLWEIYESEKLNQTRKAEKFLALDLYSYLFDQGIDFYIEPSSIDGEIDLISTEITDDPLLADAKIFDGNKYYLCKAFNQIYTYTKQYDEPFGYLVIYNVSDKNLELSLELDSRSIPFAIYDNKTIFFVKIDIYLHSESVSQRKPVKSIEIRKEDLIHSIESTDTESIDL